MKVIETNDVCPVILTSVLKEWASLKEGEEEELLIITNWEAVGQELEKWLERQIMYLLEFQGETRNLR